MNFKILLFALMCTFAISTNAQTQLYGKWDAHCAMEQVNNQRVSFCELCPKTSNDTTVTINSFSVEFDSTHVTFGDSDDKIPYMKKPSGNYITFVKDKRPYGFDVMVTTSNDLIVLKSKAGIVVVLERKKEKAKK